MILDLHLAATGSAFSFSPGQWVDFVVPKHSWVGGFSIASSTRDLPLVRLAVKKSNHPPAAWVHNNLPSTDEIPVEISVGGTCTLLQEQDERTLSQRPSYFIAGGIGISPVLSQYREFLYHRDKVKTDVSDDQKPKTFFLYSVSTPEELVFGDDLIELSRYGSKSGLDAMIFTLTKTGARWDDDALDNDATTVHVERRYGRQLKDFLSAAPDDAVYYVCGPPAMIDEAVELLKAKDIPDDDMRYEKWW
ncbi:MAG: hypothetical protein SGILL_008336 [Bacillariaceae sp.]